MEIERKFLIRKLPDHLEDYPSYEIEQAYLNKEPVLRIRRSKDRYILTMKSGGMLAHEEYEIPMSREAFLHLLPKTDGRIIRKTRYKIPYNEELTIDLDIFSGSMEGLIMAEVEFPSIRDAESFIPPDWFGEDVTSNPRYHNVFMAYEGTDPA